MFARRTYQSDSFSKHRAGKATSQPKRSFREHAIAAKKTAEKSKKADSLPVG
ncbi:hypothetical protein MMC08_000046, partial [Hypocenomyce scalaris]|nr:hypothetical protein [Hypocenomyce scalaris]